MAQAGSSGSSARFGLRALVPLVFLLACAGLVAGVASRRNRTSTETDAVPPLPTRFGSGQVEGGI